LTVESEGPERLHRKEGGRRRLGLLAQREEADRDEGNCTTRSCGCACAHTAIIAF
jgi:hypothetical protein